MKTRSQTEIEQCIYEFTDLCREHDLKVTHQRLEIYRALLSLPGHPTPEEIYNRIRSSLPTVSLDTVYRTLTLFEEYGLITRVQCLFDKGRYDSNLEEHHHFICSECKKIEDFYWPEFDELTIPESTGAFGKINLKKVEIRGICNECLSKK